MLYPFYGLEGGESRGESLSNLMKRTSEAHTSKVFIQFFYEE
jgi:hypothetical protein